MKWNLWVRTDKLHFVCTLDGVEGPDGEFHTIIDSDMRYALIKFLMEADNDTSVDRKEGG